MKRFFLILMLALASASAVYAVPSFGELSFETGEKTAFYAEAGTGNVQNFGFLLAGEGRELFLRHYTSSFSQPHSLRIKGLPNGEYTLWQYAKEEGQLYLGNEVYITAADGVITVKTLEDLKEDAKTVLQAETDMSLYRQSEQEVILEIISRMDEAEAREDIEGLSQEIRAEISEVNQASYYEAVAKQNSTVLEHLKTALDELNGKRWTGKKKAVINIATGVLDIIIPLGETGDILITDSYVRDTYQTEIEDAKYIYYNEMTEAVRSNFQEEILELSPETVNFLMDFFDVSLSNA